MFPRFGAIPRFFKGFTEVGEENWTWYDKEGKETTRDPNTNPVVYDAFGKRHVFALGQWREDNPGVSPLAAPILTGLQAGVPAAITGSPAVALGVVSPGALLDYGAGQTYMFVDAAGNYIGENGKPLQPGTFEWLKRKWGSEIPDSVMDAFEAEYFDATPDEIFQLEDMEDHRSAYHTPSLVRLGKPPIEYGQAFYINGQKAIMGKPDGSRMQYAVTQSGEGDRWKYKIAQDSDGNWVRMYYRTFGAKKEKQLKEKAKDRD